MEINQQFVNEVNEIASDYLDTIEELDMLEKELAIARKEWEEEHAEQLEGLESLKASAADLKARLQQRAVQVYEVTGEKTWRFLQVAEVLKLDVENEKALIKWIVRNLDSAQWENWLKLNTSAFTHWAERHANDDGTISVYVNEQTGEQTFAPARLVRVFVSKVLESIMKTMF